MVAEHKKAGIQAATFCTEASCILATADVLVGVDWSTVDGLTLAEVQCTNKGDGNGWSTEERGRQIYFRSSFTKAVAHSLSMPPGLPKPPGQGGLWSLAGAFRWAPWA